jgi:hypothetical protein
MSETVVVTHATGLTPEQWWEEFGKELLGESRKPGNFYCSICQARVLWLARPIQGRWKKFLFFSCPDGHDHRYKLSLGHVAWRVLADVVDPETGEVLANKGDIISQDYAVSLAIMGAIWQGEAVWPHGRIKETGP